MTLIGQIGSDLLPQMSYTNVKVAKKIDSPPNRNEKLSWMNQTARTIRGTAALFTVMQPARRSCRAGCMHSQTPALTVMCLHNIGHTPHNITYLSFK